MNSKTLIFITAGISLAIMSFGVYTFFTSSTQKNSLTSPLGKMVETLKASPLPTPFPFEEMTVPYLRKKTYKSQLAELQPYAQHVSYTSYLTSYTSDGLKINGLLTRPTGEMPPGGWPAVVFIHGYIPPNQYVTTEKYTDYVDYLARNGFVVFKIDLRGHGESEGEAGGGYYGSDYVVDALNAYAALESADFVNPKKIGMWGHSMAGNIVTRSMAVKPEIPATVIWAGAVYTYLDQREYGIQDTSYQLQPNVSQRASRRRELFEKNGSPSAQSAFWQQVAPVNYVNDWKGAIAIHHAIDDDVVSVKYTRNLQTYLDASTVPHEVYEYETGGHNIIGGSFVSAMERTVAFYKKYLQ